MKGRDGSQARGGTPRWREHLVSGLFHRGGLRVKAADLAVENVASPRGMDPNFMVGRGLA